MFRGPIRAALLSLGVPPDEVGDAVSRVSEALNGALADERGAWILHGGEGSLCEFALAGLIGSEVVHTRVDRTFIDNQGVRWIVDYKTSIHEGSELEAFLAS